MQNLKQKVRQQVNKEIETIGIKEYIKKNGLDVDSESVDVETQPKTMTKKSVTAKKDYTLSIVIPASIIDNAQSFELKTYLVCQIARAAAIYWVDEIIIIESRGKFSSALAKTNPTEFFIRNLEYLESPPYLRKALFPVCPELKYSGLMNPLNIPHHLRVDEWSQYREGVVIPRPTSKLSIIYLSSATSNPSKYRKREGVLGQYGFKIRIVKLIYSLKKVCRTVLIKNLYRN